MTKAVEFDIKGIKCDNPPCGWFDMNARFIPEYWLNKPCPRCGSNLFTQKDYDAMMRLFKITRVFNFIFAPIVWFSKKKHTRHQVDMNGSGNIKIHPPEK